MSRRTRPVRRVRGPDLDGLRARVDLLGILPTFTREVLRRRWFTLGAFAMAWACRPSHLRRCLLGRNVSAKAARRILAAARGAR